MNINSNIYTIATLTTASLGVTLTPEDANVTSVTIVNEGTTSAFVVSGVTAPTAVFPTSATAPIPGKVIPAGQTQTFQKPIDHKFISAIRASGTGRLHIEIGE